MTQVNGSKLIRGDLLPDNLQQVVLARWSNRHYSKPGHKWTEQDDKEWLARHKFYVTVSGEIDMSQKIAHL
jgi:hypothetical protein